MIDPRSITNFSRSRIELEEFILFSIVVAGKNAFVQAEKLELLLNALKDHDELKNNWSPFAAIRQMDNEGCLIECLRAVKMGQYNRIATAFRGVAYFLNPISLSGVHIDLLESIKGIGMKTARFFVMHSRWDQWYACLDTHILKWLGERGHDVPRTTPNGERYRKLEQIFLGYCMFMKKTPAELDLAIWNERH